MEHFINILKIFLCDQNEWTNLSDKCELKKYYSHLKSII